MVVPAAEYLNFYKIPVGRAAFALGHVRRRAEDLGEAEIAELAGRAADECRLTLALELRAIGQSRGLYSPQATTMDSLVDRCLGGTGSYLDAQMRIFPGEPRGEAAERIMQAIFPGGVASVTRLPYAEEHAHVNVLLDRLESPELADAVALLPELPELIARLRQRNDAYGDALRTAHEAPTRAEVRQARQRCQDLLAATTGLILGLCALRDADQDDRCEQLLEPIVRQNDAMAAVHRRHGVIRDVDPDTGEEFAAEAGEDVAPDTATESATESDT